MLKELNGADTVSVESLLVSGGRDRTPGAPLNVPLVRASKFILGDRRAYARDHGTPTWAALEEIVGGMEGGGVSFVCVGGWPRLPQSSRVNDFETAGVKV